MRRISDYLLALILLSPATVICLFAGFAVWMETGKNPLFLQTRVGRHRRPFILYKLRTMKPDTAQAASHEISQSQILRVGGFLRATKLDELPQLLNVLNGTMSFVGPRPSLPSQTELIAERERLRVLQILPGITGPSQLAGIDMSDPRRLAVCDGILVDNQSFGLYCRCVVETFLGLGSGDAVKQKG